MDCVGDGLEHGFREFLGRLAVCLVYNLCHRKLAGSVNGGAAQSGDRLDVDTLFPAQRRSCRLRSLY